MTEIDFYVLPGQDQSARMTFVAKLAERILAGRHHLTIATADHSQSQALSHSLWHTKPESFLPHCVSEDCATSNNGHVDPIFICHQAPPKICHDVLINLGQADLNSYFSRFNRLIEVVVQEPSILDATRQAYQFYNARRYPIRTHNLKK